MILNVEKPYIWLPVSKNAPERKLHFYIEGKKSRRSIFILEKQIVNFTDAGMFLRS